MISIGCEADYSLTRLSKNGQFAVHEWTASASSKNGEIRLGIELTAWIILVTSPYPVYVRYTKHINWR